MKIAVPTRMDMVDGHFGHCEYYSVYSLNEENEVIKKEIIKSPEGCGCKSDIAPILQNEGVKVMLAGNMGMGALNMLAMHDIEVIRGCSGNTDEVVRLFLEGQVKDSGVGCEHHSHGHNHEHGHTCNH